MEENIKLHEKYMKAALKLAKKAFDSNEVPVGAVIVHDGKIIARGCNKCESAKNALAHAEIIAIKKATKKLGGWRLIDCTMYVTLEPCCMCGGAIINSRIPHVVFGAYNKKAGALGSIYNIGEGKLNHKPLLTGGILGEECAKLLSDYFKDKRQNNVKAK